jgi:hypothetical protein
MNSNPTYTSISNEETLLSSLVNLGLNRPYYFGLWAHGLVKHAVNRQSLSL